ncbi:MAG: glycosyltransferase family 2 protein [Luteolibacter sp.]
MNQSNDQALVSVVIPAFKARNYLADALESVRKQDYRNVEILVIDDASPEPIDDIIATFLQSPGAPGLRVVRHEENLGIAAVRNTGIQSANGEFVALLDHDDLWTPDHLSDLMKGILDNGCDIGFCSAMAFKDSPENWSGTWGPPNGVMDDNVALELFHISYITPSSAVIRKSLLTEMNGFRTEPEINACEDLDLWLRIAERRKKFHYSKRSTVFYRNHPSQATSRTAYLACQAAYVRALHVSSVPGPWIQKRALVAASWWSAFILTRHSGKIRWDLLKRSIIASLPVPWEMVRGISHLLGIKIFSGRSNQPSS